MIAVIDALLAPIARLCVARGVLFPQAADRLKAQFLAAAQTLGGADKPPTDSRISVMTGLQRRDIARLRDLPATPPVPPNPLARLVAVWLNDHEGADLSRSGDGSFDEMALRVRKDVHPRTLLEQLITTGTVAVTDDKVRLLTPYYQPLAGSDDQLAYLGANGGDFLSAATDNVMQDPAPNFEQSVHYNHLSAAAVAELDALHRTRQMALLQEISARAAALQDTSPGQTRFRAGGYFYKKETR